MAQTPRNESGRLVVCLFCGTRTFVPVSSARDTVTQPDAGVTIVRCHLCRKEAPYSASEIFRNQDVSFPEDNSRSRAAGL